MPVLISLAPGERGDSVAYLGGMLGRSTGADLVVVAITPTPWPPNPFGADQEFEALQEKAALDALARTQDIIGPDVSAEYLVQTARSVAAGVLDMARRRSASLVVLGSASGGLAGTVSLGGVAGRLLNSVDVPLCFAPSGFSAPPTGRVERITVGFGRGDTDSDLMHAAAAEAERMGVRLRVVCFAVRRSTALSGTVPFDAEDLVIAEWADSLHRDIGLALITAGLDPAQVEIVVTAGSSWREVVARVDWVPGEILAIGASTSAISRLLLGSHASKIVRNSPVPVLIIGRTTNSG